jgi:hypothetical protein
MRFQLYLVLFVFTSLSSEDMEGLIGLFSSRNKLFIHLYNRCHQKAIRNYLGRHAERQLKT